jgi:thiol-disulfide isomerase/thioredoxin
MKKDTVVLFVIVAGLSALLMARGLGRKAQTPEIFADGYTLETARSISAESGKPLFILATADWCGPCQALKRGALTDVEVVAFLRDRTVPVYLEEGPNLAEIRSLGVRAYPTTLLIRGDETMGVIEGGAGPAEYLRMIRQSLGEPG